MNGEGERNGGDDAGIRQPVHVPVLLREVQEVLALEPGQVVVDGTVGAGGHARAFVLAIAPGGTLVGFDRDSEILASAQAVLAQAVADAKAAGAEVGVSLHHSSYTNMHATLVANGHGACDRVLLDLGVSSLQLDRPERGFSFMADGPLDMRMDSSSGPTAAEWLRTVDETELADTLILDEATSALDTESEVLVQQAIERLMRNRTSFVIAHRLSTVLNANRIIVLEQGRIVQAGIHADLVGQPGLYQKLYSMQFRAAEVPA